ncbi:MAG: lipopolysaccharide export system protein LptC [Cyclobacteriaceae bacterium]|jgi:lipopolysaccharide export system protein LptC
MSDKLEKEKLLSLENHDMVGNHMYDQGRKSQVIGISEVQVQLKEEYISSNRIHIHMSELTRSEKNSFEVHCL